MPLFQLVEENSLVAERAVRSMEGRFARMERQLLRELLDFLRRLPVRDGRIVMDETSSRVLNELNSVLEKVMKKEQLREAVRDLLPEFDRIATNVAIMHGEESGIRVSRSLMNDTKQRMVQMTTQSIVTSGYDARFADPVRRTLFNHVNFGAGILETERAIRSLVSPRDGSGLLTRYVGGVARDAFHQYEGQVHKAVADIHELKNWRYVGTILPGAPTKSGKRVGGTRPQCARWVRKEIILGEELEAELRWARNNGSGLIPGTTVNTFPIYRGGYNCRHKAIPTRRTS